MLKVTETRRIAAQNKCARAPTKKAHVHHGDGSFIKKAGTTYGVQCGACPAAQMHGMDEPDPWIQQIGRLASSSGT